MENKSIQILNEIKKVIVGKDEVITKTLMAILAGGHVLLEDVPGVGKTTLAAALAAAADGETRFYNAGRLRIKESDRLSAMYSVLTALGADVTELDDGLIVRGGKQLYGAVVNGFNDHRIVMSLAVLLTRTGGSIEGAEAVSKSFPDFFDKLKDVDIDVTTK
mgnify:CR=1 FL=1